MARMKTILFILVLITGAVHSLTGIFSSPNAAGLDLEKLCLKNGRPEALTNVQNNVGKIKAYVNSGLVEFTQAFQKIGNKPTEAIALICNMVDHSLKNYMKDLVESTKLCLTKDQFEKVEVSFKIVVSLLQFGCENTKLLEKALTSPDVQCAASKFKDLRSCSYISTAGIPNANTPNLMEPPANIPDIFSRFDLIECGKIQTDEQCTIEVMEQCDDDVFVELLDSLYKYINNDIPCENLPKSSRSDASPTSVVSFMILFISLIIVSF